MTIAICLIAGVVVGAFFSWLWWRSKFATVQAQSEVLKSEALHKLSEASAKSAAEQAVFQFQQVESAAEKSAAENFTRREEALQSGVEELVKPVREQLELYQTRVESLERAGTHMHGELKSFLEQMASAHATLQRETQNLVSALRKPDVRGNWGEQTLHRIVELAGMVEHCDFDTQVSITDSSGARLRPDLIVELPNSRKVIGDAKVTLDALLDGLAAEDQSSKDAAMTRHARQLRTHVDGLSKRAYWQEHEGSVDFVVAFIPSDALLAAAYQVDAAIFDYALANNVLIASPMTLVALLKAVSYGWQQEAAARNAQEVVKVGRDMYNRLKTMTDHIVTLGSRLRTSVDAYNRVVGSFESRLVPQAKRFEQLEVIPVSEIDMSETALLTEYPRGLMNPDLIALAEIEEA